MKKITTIIILTIVSVLQAEDFYTFFYDLKETIESVKSINKNKTIQETAELVDSVNKASELGIWWMAERNPNIFTSFVEAYPNTYIWYRFNDFKKATPLQQLEITKEINTITKEK